jgi:hypothetical protein
MHELTQKEKQQQWKNIIEEYEQSGLTQKLFSQQKNISLAQFSYYRGILKPKPNVNEIDSPGSFAEVKIKTPPLDKEIRVNLPNGFQCIFYATIDSAYLKKFIEVMLSC